MSDTLTGGPKTTAQKASDLGWTVEIQRANDHLFLGAMHPQGKVGFKATWTNLPGPAGQQILADRPYWSRRWFDPKALVPAPRFLDAHLADPLGIPVENRADYAIDKRYAKTLGLTPAEADAIERRRDYDYNDGSDRMVRRHYTKRATTLTDWLNQWLSVVNPAKAPKPRKTTTRAIEPLTIGEEWTAQ